MYINNTYIKIFLFESKGASLLPGGPFLILTPGLSSYRRQLWISAQPVTHVEQGQETFTKPVAVWLRVEGILDSGGHKVLVGGQGHNRTRTIQVKWHSILFKNFINIMKFLSRLNNSILFFSVMRSNVSRLL